FLTCNGDAPACSTVVGSLAETQDLVRALGSLRTTEPLLHSDGNQTNFRTIMTTQSKDIVIIGGGIVGSATAYWLAQAADLDGRRVTVVEKDPSYAVSSTPRSAGGIRQQ